jgi:hypothetical protein
MWFCFWFDFPSFLWVGVGMGEKGGVWVMGFVAYCPRFELLGLSFLFWTSGLV